MRDMYVIICDRLQWLSITLLSLFDLLALTLSVMYVM